VVPDDASCRGTRSAVTGHVTRNAAYYRTFNASLSICWGAGSDGYSQYEQCDDHFHYEISFCACWSLKRIKAVWFLGLPP
jgi:hypothetical protein